MSCTKPIGNTGVTSCLPSDEPIIGLLFQQTEDSSGTENSLLGASVGTASYLIDKTNLLDASIRLVPLMNLVEVVDERGEDEFYTDDSKASYFLQAGQRVFKGRLNKDANPQLLGELKKWKDTQASVYPVGLEGGVFGDESGTADLKGFQIVRGSLSFSYVKATRAEPAHIMIQFTYDETVEDENIRKFENAEIEDNAKKLDGLITSNATIVSAAAAASGFTVDIDAIYGSALAREDIEGLVAADFILTETSPTPGVTSITSVTESSTIPGRYVFVVTTTLNDINDLTLSQSGYTKGYHLNTLAITTES